VSHLGRAAHRAMKKHRERLWVQAGRPLNRLRLRRHRKARISLSHSILKDAIECHRLRTIFTDQINGTTGLPRPWFQK
jgi:hypothetical protein